MPTKKKKKIELCACCGENPHIMRPLIAAQFTSNTKNSRTLTQARAVPLCGSCAAEVIRLSSEAIMGLSIKFYNHCTQKTRPKLIAKSK